MRAGRLRSHGASSAAGGFVVTAEAVPFLPNQRLAAHDPWQLVVGVLRASVRPRLQVQPVHMVDPRQHVQQRLARQALPAHAVELAALVQEEQLPIEDRPTEDDRAALARPDA